MASQRRPRCCSSIPSKNINLEWSIELGRSFCKVACSSHRACGTLTYACRPLEVQFSRRSDHLLGETCSFPRRLCGHRQDSAPPQFDGRQQLSQKSGCRKSLLRQIKCLAPCRLRQRGFLAVPCRSRPTWRCACGTLSRSPRLQRVVIHVPGTACSHLRVPALDLVTTSRDQQF